MNVPHRRRLLSTGAIDPGTLPNLELRLSGTSLSGAALDAIGTWVDSSGHGRTASQANATTKPAITGSGPGDPNSPTGHLGAEFNFGQNDNNRQCI